MFFKMPVEIGKILKATLVAYLGDAIVPFHQESACVADAYLSDVV